MDYCVGHLRLNPLPRLLAASDAALAYFTRRDLLGEDAGPVERLWELPDVSRLLRKQRPDGSWRYPGKGHPYANYSLLETFRSLRVLVEKYGFTRAHPALAKAADYLFSCQTEDGDIRGILGSQYMPYYHGMILALLIQAGYADDPRVERGLRWLLTMRQDDGAWIVSAQAVPPREKRGEFWSAPPVPPDRARPFSHMATGMALRAFAVHPRYRQLSEAQAAARLLKGRLFKPDAYYDRKAPAYWTKFQYPFWWTNLLMALDSLSLMGFPRDDADVQRGLAWFVASQRPDGLWGTEYEKAKDVEMGLWVSLAVCRVFKRFFG